MGDTREEGTAREKGRMTNETIARMTGLDLFVGLSVCSYVC